MKFQGGLIRTGKERGREREKKTNNARRLFLMKNNELVVKYLRTFTYFFFLEKKTYLPLIDVNGDDGFDWFSIGDDERIFSEFCS